MHREPDWEALSELNFLLSHRITQPLNAALSAIELAEMGDKSGKPAHWWRDRARNQIASVLNLFTAWSWLVQYKTGMQFPEKAIRPFSLQALLDWLTIHLQIVPPLETPQDVMVNANQETLQEGILLLYSVASSQGSGARIIVDIHEQHLTFRVQYARLRKGKPVKSVDALLETLGQHWRMQVIAFELKTARDFLAINKSQLELVDDGLKVALQFQTGLVGTRVDVTPYQQSQKQMVQKIMAATLPSSVPVTGATLLNNPDSQRPHLSNKEIWHLPAKVYRIPARNGANETEPEIPGKPLQPGGWHLPDQKPIRTSEANQPQSEDSSIVVSIKLPDVEPPTFIRKHWDSQELSFAIPEKRRQALSSEDLQAVASDAAEGIEPDVILSESDTIVPESSEDYSHDQDGAPHS